LTTYGIRYGDRAARQRQALSDVQRASLAALEKRLSANPFGNGALSNRDNSWSAAFAGGFITYVVSNRHVVVSVVDIVAV
jgi:hypothetical protein